MAGADPATALLSRQFPDLVAVEGKLVLQSPTTGHKIKVKIEKPKKNFLRSLQSVFKTKAATENPVHNNQPAQYEDPVPPVPPRAPLVPQNEGDLVTYANAQLDFRKGIQRAQSYYNFENHKLPALLEQSKQIRGDDDIYDAVSWDDIYHEVSMSSDQLNSTGSTPDDDLYSKEFEAVYSEMSYLRDSVKKNREANHKGASRVANPPNEGHKSPDYMIAFV